jgi:hypothetical protein
MHQICMNHQLENQCLLKIYFINYRITRKYGNIEVDNNTINENIIHIFQHAYMNGAVEGIFIWTVAKILTI